MRTKDFDKWLDTILEWSDKTEKRVLEKCNWVTKKVLYTTIQFSPTQPQARFSKGIYAGGVDREEFVNNLADPTIINKRIPTYDNMRDPFYGE